VDARSKFPEFVVTVLKDARPVAVVTLNQRTADTGDVDVWWHEIGTLKDVEASLREAYQGVGYILWKETGQVPSPIDYLPPVEVDNDRPF